MISSRALQSCGTSLQIWSNSFHNMSPRAKCIYIKSFNVIHNQKIHQNKITYTWVSSIISNASLQNSDAHCGSTRSMTNMFQFLTGVMTITLHDLTVILGIQVYGPAIGHLPPAIKRWKDIAQRLLGQAPYHIKAHQWRCRGPRG